MYILYEIRNDEIIYTLMAIIIIIIFQKQNLIPYLPGLISL